MNPVLRAALILVGSALAFMLGTAVALSRRVEYFLYPFIVMFQAMPKVALAPLIIVWFGLGLVSKVVSAALVAFFPLMVNTIVGLRSAEEDRINLMRSLAASKWQIFWMLQLPNALPYVFAGPVQSYSWEVTGGPCDRLFLTTTSPVRQTFTLSGQTTSTPVLGCCCDRPAQLACQAAKGGRSSVHPAA